MKNRKSFSLLILALVSIILFCSCASASDPQSVQRVNEALDKIASLDSAHMKGAIDINMNAGDISVDMNIDFDMKMASNEDIEMSMHMTGLMDMEMSMYGKGGNYYMYAPQISDKYIDMSSEYKQQSSENTFLDMSMFDFDAATTSMNFTENNETGTLMVDVHLGDEQMKKLIRKVYAEQNKGTGALSAQSQQKLDILESMHIDSAQYTMYLDKDNNIFKLELIAKISLDYMGQNMKLDMTAGYEVLETGDAVKVTLPDIQPGNIITLEEISGGLS